MKRKLEYESENDEATSSKELKIEEEPLDTAAGMGLFVNLCQEMFEEIITYLCAKEIVKFCLASKTLNELIGNNERIMKRIKLVFPPVGSVRDIKDSQRIYRNIIFKHRITTHEFRGVLPYIEKISLDARNIELVKKQSIYVVVSIIKRFEFATKIRAVYAESKSKKKITPVITPHLKELEVNGSWKTFCLFQNCKLLEKISFTGEVYSRENILLLKQILIKQTHLKSLKIGHVYGLFDDNKLADSKLKLKEFRFSLSYHDVTPKNKENIQNFLNLSRNTLEKLTVDNPAMLEMVCDFPNLKTVALNLETSGREPATINLAKMPFVEVLRMTETYLYRLFPLSIENLENLEKLKEFHGKSLHFNTSLNHATIEKLNLESCSFTSINMPNLQSAKFKNIDFPPNMHLNDNIQELIIDKCHNIESSLAFIGENPDVKMKKLIISKTKLSNRRMINANKHKIQELIINNIILRSSTT